MKNTKATHLVIDFFGCSNLDFTEEQLKSIITATGCNFIKYGLYLNNETQIIQLEEGYIALTFNKEYKYVAIDFCAGGENTNPKLALPLFTRLFKPRQEQTRVLRRGIIS